MSTISMVQVNQICMKILFINRPQFFVDSNESNNIIKEMETILSELKAMRLPGMAQT